MEKLLNKRIESLKFISIALAFSLVYISCATAAYAAEPAPPPISPSAMGGAFSSLMSESFKTDLATGAATLGIPIVVPPGRKNVQPNVALSYSSGNPNGVCGVGWSLPIAAIQRSTKNGVPRYANMDDITAGGDELVYLGGEEYKEYRAKLETAFTKYLYVIQDKKWIAYDKSGTAYYFGTAPASRMADPDNENRIFAWYVDRVEDAYGNAMTYSYIKEGGSLYLEYIYYTSNPECNPPLNADKRIEFVYESTERPDKIYNNRAGWETVIKKRLEKIKISIDSNKDSVWAGGEVVWTYTLTYGTSSNTSRSLLRSIQLADSEDNVLPAKIFTYQSLE